LATNIVLKPEKHSEKANLSFSFPNIQIKIK
jgi:hypothetical protein